MGCHCNLRILGTRMITKMKNTRIKVLAVLLLSGLFSTSISAENDGEKTDEKVIQASNEISKDEFSKVRERLATTFPGSAAGEIIASPVKGLYEVMIGPKVLYISADGRYLMRGEIVDLETEENLTEPRQNEAQRVAVDKVGEENMLIFGSKDLKHTLTVFTDIDCGYCRKLHGEMESYNEAGIRIRYLFFPRAGVNSESYKKAVSVWCSEDQKDAMTKAKTGANIEMKVCDNPVKNHMALGQLLGVRGTPAMVLEDGRLLPGYVPAARLKSFLN